MREVLHIKPNDRLDADQLTHRLRFWTLESKFGSADGTLNDMVLHGSDLNMIRMINDELVQALPANLQIHINNLLEQRPVSADDLGVLQKIRDAFNEISLYRRIGVLAAVKYMHELCDAPSGGHDRGMQLKSVSGKSLKSFDHFTIVELGAEGWPLI